MPLTDEQIADGWIEVNGTPSARITGDKDRENPVEGAHTAPSGDVERAVMVCPQCEGEGGYPDGMDEAACHTECTRCGSNGWIVDQAAIAAMRPAVRELKWSEPHPSHSYPNWYAFDLNVHFEARIDTGKAAKFGKFPLSINTHTVDEKFDTVDAAKAYAQSDYERRILAALRQAGEG